MNIYQYILLSNLIYIYIYIYIYTYMNIVGFFLLQHCPTHTYDGHTGFTFTWSFPAGFNSRNGLHNCEHDPSY